MSYRRLPITRTALASLAALSTASVWAGPAVGSYVGKPSSSVATVNARVISSTPVVAQVAVPTQACYDELQATPPRSSGAGAIIGAIAGAALGNAVGKGAGNAIATGVGLMGGAVLGNHIETDGRPGGTQTVRRCSQQTAYQNQVVAYDVVYELHGQRYATQMGSEPGRTIPVQLTVTPAVAAPVQQAPVWMQQPVVAAPSPVTVVGYRPGVVVDTRFDNGRHDGWHRHGWRGRGWD
jgi:uncharacterized protein YcfJ